MTDIIDDGNAAAEETDAMRDAMRRLMGNFPAASPKKAERKQREKKARSLVDGRTLKAKGRTEQLNVKVRPDVKQALAALADADGISITDWLERTVEEKRGAMGG
jgi:predicted HicB family RNase H-like nuclease